MGSAEYQAAAARAKAAVSAARSAVESMLELVDPIGSEHDDVAELILAVMFLGDLFRSLRPAMDAAVLQWLLENEGGVRSVRVGDLKYWGELDKSVKCLDVGEAGGAAAVALHYDEMMEAALGDESTVERFLAMIRDLFRQIVSANGLKEGATRDALMAGAERQLRAAHAADPDVIQVGDGETAGVALERAVEAAREHAFLTHFEENWPDKLKGGEPKTKLGVGNLRFVHRQGGGTKAHFEELERQRLAAGVIS